MIRAAIPFIPQRGYTGCILRSLPPFLSTCGKHRSNNSPHSLLPDVGFYQYMKITVRTVLRALRPCRPFYRHAGGAAQTILRPPSPVLSVFVVSRFNFSAAPSVTKAGAVPHSAVLPRPLWWHTEPRRSVGNRPSFARTSARGGPLGFHGIQISAVKPAAFGALHRDADVCPALRQHRPLLAPWADEPKAVIPFLRHRPPPFHIPDAGPVL